MATSPTTKNSSFYQIGRYMLEVTTKTLESLRQEISQSLSMLNSLFEMSTLDRDHLELNNTTVNWLRNIKPVLEKNSMMYEQKKFDLEERLQGRIIALNKKVEEMFPRYCVALG